MQLSLWVRCAHPAPKAQGKSPCPQGAAQWDSSRRDRLLKGMKHHTEGDGECRELWRSVDTKDKSWWADQVGKLGLGQRVPCGETGTPETKWSVLMETWIACGKGQ